MASIPSAADFHRHFRSQKTAITNLLDAPNPLLPIIAAHLSFLCRDTSQILPSLPTYDQRCYDLQLKELEGQLAVLRAKGKPKSRFTFTSKPESTSAGQGDGAVPPVNAETPVAAGGAETCTSPRLAASSHSISGKRGVRIRTSDFPAFHTGYTLSLSDLEECIIDLRPRSAAGTPQTARHAGKLTALHAQDLKRCLLITPFMTGSALLHEIHDSRLILGAHQFRMHESTSCSVALYVPSVPIIEGCRTLTISSVPRRFMPNIPKRPNMVAELVDFCWFCPGPSPNWRLGQEAEVGMGGWTALDDDEDVMTVLHRIIDGCTT